ncbi:MAG: peptide chain release factor N(5)-glutamine methyltransferase [Pseudomonadota bacterium]|nr:peptide chain release factor N(5)-glutamine methyltransferase [Pseudomonadota bacterium]
MAADTELSIQTALACLDRTEGITRQEVEQLLCQVLAQPLSYLRTWPERALTSQQALAFQAGLARLIRGEPLAYILGEQAFWTLRLNVTPDTLIPRPDTECLVEAALSKMSATVGRVLDLGTGSGAIALALASERQHWQVVATDLSAAALSVAASNALKNSLSNCEFRQGAWFGALQGKEQFDVIVSNPPYIDPNDQHLVHLSHEPISALTAPEQGLADLRQIIHGAAAYLFDQGWLLVEHGYDQGAAVRALFEQTRWQQIETLRDYGGNERVTLGQYCVTRSRSQP